MIAKCTKGRSAHGGLAYDMGPGRAEEHRNGHQVGGNVAGHTWRERAYVMDQHARAARPDVSRPVHRTALRVAEQDRALSDREWRQVAERYVAEMGFSECPWTAIRHGDEHIHVTVCRVKWNGDLASDANDYRRAHRAARVIEREHGLVDASARSDPGRPQAHSGERLRAHRTGARAASDVLRDRIDDAIRDAAGSSRERYEAQLADRGVRAVANQTSDGKVNGYRYHLEGHTDPAGRPVWFKGSQLGQSYRWTQLARRVDPRARREDGHGERIATAQTSAKSRASAVERAELRARLSQAVRQSRGTRDSFEENLRSLGVEAQANQASTGRMNGYRYRLADARESSRGSSWWKGSELGKEYTWRRLETEIADRRLSSERSTEVRDQARREVNRIRRLDQPEASRARGQDAAARLTPSARGHESMERESGPAGVTDPRDDPRNVAHPESTEAATEDAASIVRRLREARDRRERDAHGEGGHEL